MRYLKRNIMTQELKASIHQDLMAFKTNLMCVIRNWFCQVIWIQLAVLVGGGTEEVHVVGPCALIDCLARAEETARDLFFMDNQVSTSPTFVDVFRSAFTKTAMFFRSYKHSATLNDKQFFNVLSIIALFCFSVYQAPIWFFLFVAIGYGAYKAEANLLSVLACAILFQFFFMSFSFSGLIVTIFSCVSVSLACFMGGEIAGGSPNLSSFLGPISTEINGETRPRKWFLKKTH